MLWGIDEAAYRVHMGRTKFYGYLTRNEIPSIVLGGRRVVAEQDLAEFVERLRREAVPFE